jgi:hypothetical protein
MATGRAAALPRPAGGAGTPAFSLGAYDEVLGRIAESTGDTVAARDWWAGAREQGRRVGSPQQVALARRTWRGCRRAGDPPAAPAAGPRSA